MAIIHKKDQEDKSANIYMLSIEKGKNMIQNTDYREDEENTTYI